MCVFKGRILIVQGDDSERNFCVEYLSAGICKESRLLEEVGSVAIFLEVIRYKEMAAGI